MIIILEYNKTENHEILAENTKILDKAKIESKAVQRKTNSLVNAVSDEHNTVTVTASLRPYHEKHTETNDIPSFKESFHDQTKQDEESGDDEDEEKEDNEVQGAPKSKNEESSPKLGDYKFDVSLVYNIYYASFFKQI